MISIAGESWRKERELEDKRMYRLPNAPKLEEPQDTQQSSPVFQPVFVLSS
jgi:hypothetical protein